MPVPRTLLRSIVIAGVATCALATLYALRAHQRPQASKRVSPSAAEPRWTNSLGMTFARIPAGRFLRGRGEELGDWGEDELPRHRVSLSQPFLLGTTEVTQAQWVAVMGQNPSAFVGADLPVECVSWADVQVFIHRLNAREGTDAYRLPTEAEWEYACRAGTAGRFSSGEDEPSLDRAAWFQLNAGNTTHPVGQKQPNAWGLHDMHGNVWEWCQDWYDREAYAHAPEVDPKGPLKGLSRVARGGSFTLAACRSSHRLNDWGCRSAHRFASWDGNRDRGIGFRLARTLLTDVQTRK